MCDLLVVATLKWVVRQNVTFYVVIPQCKIPARDLSLTYVCCWLQVFAVWISVSTPSVVMMAAVSCRRWNAMMSARTSGRQSRQWTVREVLLVSVLSMTASMLLASFVLASFFFWILIRFYSLTLYEPFVTLCKRLYFYWLIDWLIDDHILKSFFYNMTNFWRYFMYIACVR